MGKISTSELMLPPVVSKEFSFETTGGTVTMTIRKLSMVESMSAVEYGDLFAAELQGNPVKLQDEIVHASPRICNLACNIAMAQVGDPDDCYDEREVVQLLTQSTAWTELNKAFVFAVSGDEASKGGDDSDPLPSAKPST